MRRLLSLLKTLLPQTNIIGMPPMTLEFYTFQAVNSYNQSPYGSLIHSVSC